MSVFLVVMKGEFDALLAWPFKGKVTLTVLDQSSDVRSREHYSDSFRPDSSSSSFQRPMSSMNIPSGLPLFIPLARLLSEDNRYVRDDSLFLRVTVGTP